MDVGLGLKHQRIWITVFSWKPCCFYIFIFLFCSLLLFTCSIIHVLLHDSHVVHESMSPWVKHCSHPAFIPWKRKSREERMLSFRPFSRSFCVIFRTFYFSLFSLFSSWLNLTADSFPEENKTFSISSVRSFWSDSFPNNTLLFIHSTSKHWEQKWWWSRARVQQENNKTIYRSKDQGCAFSF